MFRIVSAAALLLASSPTLAAPDAEIVGSFETLRAADLRVAAIGERLALANAGLCDEHQYRTGLLLHDIRQYDSARREEARAAFGFARDIAVEAVLAGSPAEKAGLRRNDALVALNGEGLDWLEDGADGFARMAVLLDRMDGMLAQGELRVDVLRGGQRLGFTIHAAKGCATRFQLLISPAYTASADGQYVQLTTALADYAANDDELAATIAHEFAHNILRHRARLNAAGIDRGLFGKFGRSARLVRETEIEADRLSLYLLANAGYDPQGAVTFWNRFGREHGHGIFSDSTHLRYKKRVALIEAELALLNAEAAARPLMPDLLKKPLPALE